jgi:hypothetical protein
MNKTMKKFLFFLIIPALWIITLGVHVEHNVNSNFNYPEGNAWNQFESGAVVFYVNTWLGGTHRSIFGIPYLLYINEDVPPYCLNFTFTAKTNIKYSQIVIDQINIEYDDGSAKTFLPSTENKVLIFELDERGKDRGKTPYYRVHTSFCDLITSRSSFKATVIGKYKYDSINTDYKQTIRVEYRRESHIYPGWIALALKGV